MGIKIVSCLLGSVSTGDVMHHLREPLASRRVSPTVFGTVDMVAQRWVLEFPELSSLYSLSLSLYSKWQIDEQMRQMEAYNFSTAVTVQTGANVIFRQNFISLACAGVISNGYTLSWLLKLVSYKNTYAHKQHRFSILL